MVIFGKELKLEYKTFKPVIIIMVASFVLALIYTVFQMNNLDKKVKPKVDITKQRTLIGQIGSSLQEYSDSNTKLPDNQNCDWENGTHFLTCLKNKSSIDTIPENINKDSSMVSCSDAGDMEKDYQNGFCYDVNPSSDEAVVYTTIHPSYCANNSFNAFYVWSTADKKAGIICLPSGYQPTPGNQIFIQE